jgi:hypothetical protein
LTREETARAGAYVRSVLHAVYREKATGPDAFDCWGLAHHCQRCLFDRELPIAGTESFEEIVRILRDPVIQASWPMEHQPSHGALVVFYSAPERHVGTWLSIDGGGVLHIAEGAGVKFETPLMMSKQGWGRMHFHRFAGCAS